MLISGTTILSHEEIGQFIFDLVSSYDVGILPIINGRLCKNIDGNSYAAKVTVEKIFDPETNSYKWTIFDRFNYLSRTGKWISAYKARKNKKIQSYILFDTAQNAIEFYFDWKDKVIKKAKKILEEDPNTILNY